MKVDLFIKGLIHIGYGEQDQSSGTAGAQMRGSVLLASNLANLVGTGQLVAGFAFVVSHDSLQSPATSKERQSQRSNVLTL